MSEDAALMEALSGNSLNLDTSINIVPPVVKTTETKSTDEELMNGLAGNVVVADEKEEVVSETVVSSIDSRLENKSNTELDKILSGIEIARERFKGVDIEKLRKKRQAVEGSAWDNNYAQFKYKETGENPYNIDGEEFTSEFSPLKLLEMEGYVDNHLDQKKKLNDRLNDPNIIRSGLADALLNSDMSIRAMNAFVTTAEWSPVSAAAIDFADMPEQWRIAKSHFDKFRETGDKGELAKATGVLAWNAGIGFLNVVSAGAVLGKGARTLGNVGGKKAIKRFADADKKAGIKREIKITEAKRVADLNPKVREEIRLAYAESLDPSLITVVNGVKEINYDAVRIAGQKKAEEVYNLSKKRADDTLQGRGVADDVAPDVKAAYNVSEDHVFLSLVDEASELVSPLLNPAKLDAIVAIATDAQKAGVKFDPSKTVIDNLFDLTAEGKLLADGAEGLPELLGKYGLSFDDYVLAISGSASQAGKILQKMSMIRKSDPNASAAGKARAQANIEGTFKRLENMRRGVMTSQFKTAARNLQSVFLRSPFDGLETVTTDVLKGLSDDGIVGGVTTAFTRDTWKKGFGHWKYMFRKGGEGKELTDYLLKNPGLGKKYDDLLGTVSELRRRTGGDSGKVLPHLERVTDSLMVFNRQQDFFVRRATFAAEIQRLTKNEFGEELFKIIDDGNIEDLIQGVGRFAKKGKKGKKSFSELADEAIRTSLERTYAARPQLDAFDDVAKAWSNYGLTVIEEFPRFVLSSLEYITEASGAGLFMPAIRKSYGYQNRRMKAINKIDSSRGNPDSWSIREKGLLGSLIETEGDRRQISRGMIGLSTIMAMSKMWSDSESAPEDYKLLPTPNGGQMDITPLFPLRQISFLSRWVSELSQGTAAGWFEGKEFIETFTGSQFKTGQSNPILDGVADIVAGISDKETDVFSGFYIGQLAGRIFGDKLTTVLMPYNYVTDFQRSFGWRDKRLVDVKKDPNQGSGFLGGVGYSLDRVIDQKGFNLPSSDKDRPDRVNAFNSSSERFAPILNMTFGWRQTDRDDDWADTWKARGFKGWQVGKRTMIPSAKRVEALQMNKLLQGTTDDIKDLETKFRNEYNSFTPEKQKKLTSTIFGRSAVEAYVDTKLKPIMTQRMSDVQKLVYDKPEETADIIILQEGFRKLYSESVRRAATLSFRETKDGERPDYLSMSDMLSLYNFADQSTQPKISDLKAYKKIKKRVGETKYLDRVNKIRKKRGGN